MRIKTLLPELLIFGLLAGAAILVAYFLKWPAFLFPRAEVYDITGDWLVTLNITTPYTGQGNLSATINQDQSGRFQGTVTDSSGQNTKQISGQVTNENFLTDTTRVVMEATPPNGRNPITYEADVVFEGAITDGGNKISGNIDGQLIKPAPGPIRGTFLATRQSAPPPSATPIPSATLTPSITLTPSPTATVPVPSPTSEELSQSSVPTATSTPLPTSTLPPSSNPTPTSGDSPYGQGGAPVSLTPTPSRTITPSPTLTPTRAVISLTPTPSELPQAGGAWPTLAILGVGIVFILLGSL